MALKNLKFIAHFGRHVMNFEVEWTPQEYKDYILTILFVKYISDKSKRDSDYLLEVPEGGSFSDMVELKGDAEIGDKINKIITKIAEANDLLNVINNADFADDSLLGKGKKMVDRLTKLISIFEGLDFESNRVGGSPW